MLDCFNFTTFALSSSSTIESFQDLEKYTAIPWWICSTYYIFLVAVWFKDVFRFFHLSNWGKIHPIRFFSVGLERTTYNVDPYQFDMGLCRPLIGVITTFISGRGSTLELCYDCFQFLLARRDLGNWYQLHPVYILKRKSRPFTKMGLQKEKKEGSLESPFCCGTCIAKLQFLWYIY